MSTLSAPLPRSRSTLSAAATRFHEILDRDYFGDRPVPYAFLNAETLLPFTEEEAELYPINREHLTGYLGCPSYAAWLGFENTPSTIGNYLAALVRAAEMDPQPEHFARIRRVFATVRNLMKMGEEVNGRGWLCKPYGGKPSLSTTNDQNAAVVAGLYQLSRHPEFPHATEAVGILRDIADFWIDHDYRTPLDVKVRPFMGQSQWGLVTMTFVRAAYAATGDPRYAEECERLCRVEKCDQPSTSTPDASKFIRDVFPDEPAIVVRKPSAYQNLVIEALDILIDTWSERRADWERLLREFWTKQSLPGFDSDGLLYASREINTETGEWKPIRKAGFFFPPGINAENAAFLHHHWVGRYKSGGLTALFVASAVDVGARIPGLTEQARAAAEKALLALVDTPMTMINDPQGDQEYPKLGNLRKKMLDGRWLAKWLEAYWKGKKLGWWD